MYLYNTQKNPSNLSGGFFVFVMKIFRLKFALLMKILLYLPKAYLYGKGYYM
mgnify:CR=1 FL=1